MLAASRIAGGLLLAVAVVVTLLDFRDLRVYHDQSGSAPLAEATGPGPFHTYSHAPAARRAVQDWRVDPERAKSILRASLDRYPLESAPWLGLARIEASERGDFSSNLAANLESAVATQPKASSVRWEAAQIALHAGDPPLAQHHLEEWVKGDAKRVPVAISIVRRWITEPEALVAAMIPSTPEHQTETMEFAFRQRDRDLAEVVWQDVADTQNLDSPLFLTYADFLLRVGETERLVALWSQFDRHYRPGDVPNGDFSRELGAARGLNWDVAYPPDGVRIERDTSEFHDAPASLHLDFKGTHNLRLNKPRIRLPVQMGMRYRLSGFWKGRALTTRARPSINVRTLGARWNERIPVPGDLFDWQEFSVEFEVPETVRLIEFSVLRDPTNNFDRNIDGDLWLDSLRLDLLPDSAPDAAAETAT